MNAAIALFVKTPGLSPVKTRLAATIGKKGAEEFYMLSLKATEKTVKDVGAIAFWAVGEKGGLDDPLWSGFKTIHTGEGDLGQRQHHIYETLLAKHERVILIGADAPQLSCALLEEAIKDLNTNDFVIGPARDGGYYLFGGRTPVDRNIWESVPWSTDKTREKMESALFSKPFQLPFLTDVDTQDDLQYIMAEMPKTMSAEQKHVVDWIKINR